MFEERRPGTIVTYDTRALANESVNRSPREQLVLKCLAERPMTVKQIVMRLYEDNLIPVPERNTVAPRVTELCDAGIIEEAGQTTCEYTKRTVTVFRIKRAE